MFCTNYTINILEYYLGINGHKGALTNQQKLEGEYHFIPAVVNHHTQNFKWTKVHEMLQKQDNASTACLFYDKWNVNKLKIIWLLASI